MRGSCAAGCRVACVRGSTGSPQLCCRQTDVHADGPGDSQAGPTPVFQRRARTVTTPESGWHAYPSTVVTSDQVGEMVAIPFDRDGGRARSVTGVNQSGTLLQTHETAVHAMHSTAQPEDKATSMAGSTERRCSCITRSRTSVPSHLRAAHRPTAKSALPLRRRRVPDRFNKRLGRRELSRDGRATSSARAFEGS
jgi:hypothetical protein